MEMLDIWLGTVDRVDLEKGFLVPERQLWYVPSYIVDNSARKL